MKTVLLFCILFATLFAEAKNIRLFIHFNNYINNERLIFDSVHYKNELKQDYTVSKFKYYISNIKLINSNGKIISSNGYYLISEDDDSQIIPLEIPEGEYSSLIFTLGIDSLHNCSGVQTGALDPAKGMFWSWNSGYIFLKMEGNAAVSKSTAHLLEFHIGGFHAPDSCSRNFKINFQKKLINTDNNINIKTDLAELFKNPTTIDFSRLSSVTDFHNAKLIADNYSDLFSLMNIEEK